MITGNKPLHWDRARSIRRVGFLALEEFPMVALSCAIEVLRTANQLAGDTVYSWTVMTTSGGSARASDGVTQVSGVTYAQVGALDLALVCADTNVMRVVDEDVIALLRRMAKDDVALGGMCSGTYALVKAGLMDGYNCTVQWDDMARLRQDHPAVNFLDRLSVIDRNRLTCAGGIAPVDLMLTLIGGRFDAKTIAEISARVGARHTPVKEEWEEALGEMVPPRDRRVISQIISLMQENLEEPLPARALANAVGVSLRQIQRLFQVSFGTTLTNYYLRLRLEHARQLVLNSECSLTEIAVTCGFASPAHFSRSYRTYYGRAPSSERPRRWVLQERC